ncbi:hypothetical protein COL35_17330, partial [Bacillus toyonensis]
MVQNRKDSNNKRQKKNQSRHPVAMTATGPIFKSRVEYALVPLSSALAILQELAVKIVDPEAKVSSSLATRVKGKDAYESWMRLATEISVRLIAAAPEVRFTYLRTVLNYLHKNRKIDGLEPILTSAINAVWPWLSLETTERVLNYSSKLLKESKIACSYNVPIVDPLTRSITLYKPDELTKIDTSIWIENATMEGFGSGGFGSGGFGSGGFGSGG